jgi:hypothetical protein
LNSQGQKVAGIEFNEGYKPVFDSQADLETTRLPIFTVETAFVHGNLQEEIYMTILEGTVVCSK